MPTEEQIRKKRQGVKSGDLKFNKSGFPKGTPKPRRGIKEAEKLHKENVGSVKRKTVTRSASFFGAGDIESQIKKHEEDAKPRKRAPWTKMKGMGMVGGGGKK
tara:strand:- start:757 stop:1065 length:309 start_codon:yes stop_codon:yes gene_type:complete